MSSQQPPRDDFLARALGSDPAELALHGEATPGCADPNDLAALAQGALPEDARRRLLDHVADCPRCLLALDAGLDEASAEPKRAARPLAFRPLMWFAVAAAAVALFFALDGRRSTGTEGTRELARLEPLEVPVSRGSTATTFERAAAAYADGDRAGVIEMLASTTTPDDPSTLLLGSSLLLEGRAREALDALLPLCTGSEGVHRQARWTAAQAWLVLEQPAEAQGLLEGLAAEPGVRAADARDQLQALRAAQRSSP